VIEARPEWLTRKINDDNRVGIKRADPRAREIR